MNKRQSTQTVLFVMIAIITISCSKREDTKLEQIIQRRDESCQYSYSQGDLAPLTVSSPKMKTTYFDKQFDENKLAAVLDTSAAETVRFAEMTGVKYYKTTFMQAATDACAFAGDLPSAPNQLMSFFNSGGDSVLGVYLPKMFQGYPDLANSPAILVRIDSDRWTLVHEYMHHLFSSLENTKLTDDQVKKNYGNQMDGYLSKIKSAKAGISSEKNYREAVDYLSAGDASLIELLKRFFLEEMTIEANLGEKFDARQMEYVPASMRLNGAAYTLSSAEKIKAFLSLHEDEISKTRLALNAEGSAKYKNELNKLQADLDAFTKLRTEMRPLVSKATDYYYRHGLASTNKSMAAIVADIDQHSQAGCSHSKQGEEILESAQTRFKQ